MFLRWPGRLERGLEGVLDGQSDYFTGIGVAYRRRGREDGKGLGLVQRRPGMEK